jgi:hypothetical protein
LKPNVNSLVFAVAIGIIGQSQLWAQQQLYEDFSNGLAEWDLAGSPISKVFRAHGEDNVFDNNGDGWCLSNAASKQPISIRDGATIQADVYLQVDDLSGCWVDISLGLTKKEFATSGDCTGDGFVGYRLARFEMVGDACWARPVDQRRHSYVSGPSIPRMLADDYTNGWHTLSAVIDTGGFVDVYLDDLHIGRSTEAISEYYRTDPFLLLGERSSGRGGKAYIDNVVVGTEGVTWVPADGNVQLADGTPICAMVLANGQHIFSCDGGGAFDLDVPLDANGQITLFSFADGFAPFSATLDPDNFPFTVFMESAPPGSQLISMSHETACATNDFRLAGDIQSSSGDPLCAMVLANGQQMFTCGDSLGRYDLTVPADENGKITVFGFADGFQPYRHTFTAESDICSSDVTVEEIAGKRITIADMIGNDGRNYRTEWLFDIWRTSSDESGPLVQYVYVDGVDQTPNVGYWSFNQESAEITATYGILWNVYVDIFTVARVAEGITISNEDWGTFVLW